MVFYLKIFESILAILYHSSDIFNILSKFISKNYSASELLSLKCSKPSKICFAIKYTSNIEKELFATSSDFY
jgi:hypothetical protein